MESSPFSIEEHNHRFSVWAASRAAQATRKRFSVGRGKLILEEIGFDRNLSHPDKLPQPSEMPHTPLVAS